MLKKEIRVALIGHQFMGIAHSNAYRNAAMWTGLPVKVTMKCLCAHDTMDKLKVFAAKYGWEGCETDWRNVVKRDDIDLISIAAPNYLHKEIAIEAAKNGKHILCEKPLANNLYDAREMLDAVEKASVKHCCGYSYRFTPSLALACQLVQEGRIGRIYHVFVRYAQDWITNPNFGMVWRFDKKIAGSGSLGDLSAHSIDATRFVTGLNFKEVTGNMQTLIKERPVNGNDPDGPKGKVTVEDVAQFLVNFEGGATGCFESTRLATGRKNYNTIEINGEKGSIFWNFEDQNSLLYYDNTQSPKEAGFRKINTTHDVHPYNGGWWPQGHGIGYADSFVIEVAEFIRSIVEDTPFSPDFEDGVQCQKVLEAVEKSAISRTWVKV
ncbi:MAG TPA: Gfo/Idh/MocA family oxidoreductase [Bacteroidales bacterium]|nr:Gfo/Idh/MocA family oxidoreductase [Bacteroidales bacterium]